MIPLMFPIPTGTTYNPAAPINFKITSSTFLKFTER